jgi:hypothetical protein|tara:strand:- start:596 stop:2059 length:1464 start_codon:yes stop_codon:yes gene_type:complete
MKINEFDNQLSQGDLDSLETFADKVFGKVGIDVNFTRHFLDRVNDERNVKQISMGELTRLFKQEAKRFSKPIAQLGPDAEAVMKDLQTDLNLPFVLVWDDRNEELDLIAKTVMRKKDFKTSDPEFTIEVKQRLDPECWDGYKKDGTKMKNGTRVNNCIKEDANKTNMVSPEGELRSILSQYVDTYIAKGWRIATRKDIHRKFTEEELSEWDWKKPLSFPRPDVIGSKMPYKDRIKTIKLPIGNIKKVREESTISTMNKEDPNDPEVHIQGYGVVTLRQLEKSIVKMIHQLAEMAEQGKWDNINHNINKGLLQTKLQAVIDTKEDLQRIRKQGGTRSRGIATESQRERLFDILIGEDKMNTNEESPFDALARKYQVAKHKKGYARAAKTLHAMLQRKHEENEGHWRHSFSWYVAKIADGFKNIKSSVLEPYYLENYESAFITESGGVGRVVPGVNTTVDVGPDEIKKQAKKFGNDVDKDGVPKHTHRK